MSCYERIFHRPVFFTALLSISMFTYFGIQGSFSTGVLTTLQRDFKFKSSEIGLLLTVNDIVGLIIVTPVSYLGAKGHRPRILGIFSLIFALGCFVNTIPQFISDGDDATKYVDDMANQTEVDGAAPPINMCVVGIDEDGVEETSCSAAEKAASGAQYQRAVWLFIAQVLCGIGGVGYFPLGISYIDDGVSRASSSMHVAALFMIGSLSPMFGYGMSALSLSYHTDFYKIDVDELGYDDKDPRWIGAWWLGYLLYSAIFVVISIPYFFFPKEWPEREEENSNEEMTKMTGGKGPVSPSVLMTKMMPKEGTSLIDTIKGYFKALVRLLTNITYLGCVSAVCAELAVVAGFFSFAGRYIQTQYDVSPALTSIILGCATTPATFFGNFFGGLIVKKMRLSMRGLALMSFFICGTALLLTPFNFAVGCDNARIAGVTLPYPGQTEMNLEPMCTESCEECPMGTYTPVCGSDGVTYITPCHAGCTVYAEGASYDGEQTTTSHMYGGCSCIGSNSTFEDDIDMDTPAYNYFTAVQESCKRDCFSKLIGFVVIFVITLLINSTIKNPSFMLKLRCVHEEDRAISLGLGSLLIRVLGFVPAPIYFGVAIQTSCLMFQKSCGITGNCLIYDSNKLRNVVFGLVLVLKFCSLLGYSISLISIRKNKAGVYQQTQLCMKKTEQEEAI